MRRLVNHDSLRYRADVGLPSNLYRWYRDRYPTADDLEHHAFDLPISFHAPVVQTHAPPQMTACLERRLVVAGARRRAS